MIQINYNKIFLICLSTIVIVCNSNAYSQTAETGKSGASYRQTTAMASKIADVPFPCDGKIYFFRNSNGANWLSYIDQYTTATPVVADVCKLTVTNQNAMAANPIDHFIYFVANPHTLYRLDAACKLTALCTSLPTTDIGCFDYLGRFWIVSGNSLMAYDVNTCTLVKGPYTLSSTPGVDIVFSSTDCHFYMGDNNNVIAIDTNGVIDNSFSTGFGASGSIGGIAVGVDGNLYAIPNNSVTGQLYKYDVTTHAKGTLVYTFPSGTASPCGCDMASFPCPELTSGFSVSPGQVVCSSSPTIQFTNTTSGLANKWSWDFGDGNKDSVTFNPSHTYAAPGTYKVRLAVSAITRCLVVPPDTFSMDIQVLPSPVASITGDTLVCSGATITLTASGGLTYSWNTGGTADTINVSPTITTIYTVTVKAINDCTAKSSITVTVSPSLAVNAGSSASICAGSNITLSATAPGAISYSWSPGGSLDNPNIANPVATPGATTIYTVNVTDAGGCTGTGTVTITVNPLPVVSFAPFSASVCETDAAFILTGGAPAGGTYSGAGVNGNTFDPLIAGIGNHTLYYIYTDGNNCTNIDSALIQVDPVAVVTVDPVTDLCLSSPAVTLNGSPAGGTFSGPGVTGNTFNPSLAGVGTHTITYTYVANGICTKSAVATTSVTVLLSPTVTIAASPTTGCEKNTIYLGYGQQYVTLTATSNATITSYQWYLNGAAISGATKDTIHVNTGGNYNVIASAPNGCISDSSTTASYLLKVVDVRCGNDLKKVVLCHVPPGNPRNPQTLCIAPSAVPAHLDKHPGDCLGPCSFTKRLGDLNEEVAIEEAEFEVFPNPFSDNTTVEFVVPDGGKAVLKLYDMKGKLIMIAYDGETVPGAHNVVEIDGRKLADGIYIGILTTSLGTARQKFIVTR